MQDKNIMTRIYSVGYNGVASNASDMTILLVSVSPIFTPTKQES